MEKRKRKITKPQTRNKKHKQDKKERKKQKTKKEKNSVLHWKVTF